MSPLGQAMEVSGEVQQDEVSIRSLPMDTEVSEATSPAHAAGDGVQTIVSGTKSMLRDKESVMSSTSMESDRQASPGLAVTPRGSSSVVVGRDMPNTRGRDTSKGAVVGPSVSALSRQDNTGEQGAGRRASQPQAEAQRKRKKKDASTRRSSHSGQKLEDKSVLRAHGTTRGHPREQGRSSLSDTQTGSRWVGTGHFRSVGFTLCSFFVLYPGVCEELG